MRRNTQKPKAQKYFNSYLFFSFILLRFVAFFRSGKYQKIYFLKEEDEDERKKVKMFAVVMTKL